MGPKPKSSRLVKHLAAPANDGPGLLSMMRVRRMLAGAFTNTPLCHCMWGVPLRRIGKAPRGRQLGRGFAETARPTAAIDITAAGWVSGCPPTRQSR